MKAFETAQDFDIFRSDVEGLAVSYDELADGSAIVTCSDGVKLLVSPNGDSRLAWLYRIPSDLGCLRIDAAESIDCAICDRPKSDCACVENGGTY